MNESSSSMNFSESSVGCSASTVLTRFSALFFITRLDSSKSFKSLKRVSCWSFLLEIVFLISLRIPSRFLTLFSSCLFRRLSFLAFSRSFPPCSAGGICCVLLSSLSARVFSAIFVLSFLVSFLSESMSQFFDFTSSSSLDVNYCSTNAI